MGISKMRHATLIAHESFSSALMPILEEMETFHITEFGSDVEEDQVVSLKCPVDVQSEIADYDLLISQTKYVMDFIIKYNGDKKGFIDNMLGVKPLVSLEEWSDFVKDSKVEVKNLWNEAKDLESKISNLSNRKTHLMERVTTLNPWLCVNLDLSQLDKTKKVKIVLATSNARTYLTSLKKIAEQIPEFSWELIKAEKSDVYLLLAYPDANRDMVESMLSSESVNLFNHSEYVGVPSILMEEMDAQKKLLDKEHESLMIEVTAFEKNRIKVYSIYDHFSLERNKLNAILKFGGTQRTVIVQGWTKEGDLEKLESKMKGLSEDIVVITRLPHEGEEPPIQLENKSLITPYEMITKMMNIPKWETIDPTPLFAPFFFIFFGLCLTDAVYGLFIVALGIWFANKYRSYKGMKNTIKFILITGIGAVIVGALLGGWMGDLVTKVTGWSVPKLFDPIADPIVFIVVSLGLGIVQIIFGICIKIYMEIRDKNYFAAIFDQGSWLAIFFGVGALAGGSLSPVLPSIGKYMLIIGAVALVLTQGRHQKNIFMKLGSGLISLYNVTGYFSDIISYVRLFGLGISSAVLASVINEIAFSMAPSIPVIGLLFTIAIILVGHIFNFLIGLIGAFVHSSRLQFIEFFGKFFEGGGEEFKPFRAVTKYVEIDKSKEA